MKQSFTALRIILLVVCAANFYGAYVFFATPEVISQMYGQPMDNFHTFLAMTIGALLSVFGLGALLPVFKPLKYGAIIIMLLLMHFTIFLIDVVVLARGQIPWNTIVPEMIYFLVVSTALVRWYPVREKAKGMDAVSVAETHGEDAKDSNDGKESL